MRKYKASAFTFSAGNIRRRDGKGERRLRWREWHTPKSDSELWSDISKRYATSILEYLCCLIENAKSTTQDGMAWLLTRFMTIHNRMKMVIYSRTLLEGNKVYQGCLSVRTSHPKTRREAENIHHERKISLHFPTRPSYEVPMTETKERGNL